MYVCVYECWDLQRGSNVCVLSGEEENVTRLLRPLTKCLLALVRPALLYRERKRASEAGKAKERQSDCIRCAPHFPFCVLGLQVTPANYYTEDSPSQAFDWQFEQ